MICDVTFHYRCILSQNITFIERVLTSKYKNICIYSENLQAAQNYLFLNLDINSSIIHVGVSKCVVR